MATDSAHKNLVKLGQVINEIYASGQRDTHVSHPSQGEIIILR